jgi:hypothetical protein
MLYPMRRVPNTKPKRSVLPPGWQRKQGAYGTVSRAASWARLRAPPDACPP